MSSVHDHPADEVCVDCKDWQTGSSSSQAQPASADASAATKGSAQASTSASSSTSALNFEPPSVDSLQPSILIEFCDRCRWAPRATWTQTELFLTFPTPLLRSITLQPLTSPETGGRFRVWLFTSSSPQDRHLLWDRKTEGGFPELKVLKQRVRNVIQPDLNLGHSDAHGANRRLMGTDSQVTTAAGQAETPLPAKGDPQGVNTTLAAQIQ